MAKACISNCFSNKYDIVFYSNKSCILSNLSLPLVIFVQLVGMVLNFSFQISSLEDGRRNTYVLHTELSPQSPRSAHTELSPQSPRSAPLSRKKR